MPAVLMTELDGSVILRPSDMNAWTNGLAESLVRIHSVAADNYPWSYRTYIDIDTLEIPTWSSVPQAWSIAFDFVRGPGGIDLGHYRWNLALLFDVSTADMFLSAYEGYCGSVFSYDPYWDLLSLVDTLFGPPNVYPGWTALGVNG